MEISRNGSIIYTWPVNLGTRSPASLLRFDAAGKLDFYQAPDYQDVFSTHPVPLADVINQDGTANSAANPAPRGSTVTIIASGFGPLGNVAADGAPAGAMPNWPAAIHPGLPLPTVADIPVWTNDGNLPLPGDNGIITIAGHSNSLLQVIATIPAHLPAGPLPFFIGDWPANGNPVWTNFLYVQ